ncbi:MAG: replication factor A [Methanosarcinales archaeon]|jgi:replication factor A1|nr:replication factor A [Methanosarcinales archaeon]
MSTINEIYEKLDGIIDKKDFLKRVEEKIEKMNGLCDEQTAAMLVSKDLGVTETEGDSTISSIKAGDNVNVSAKVVSLLGIREFNRNDGSVGIVGNIKVADETSAIRVTLWDEKAELIKANKIKEGSVYQIQGYAKDGYSGIEINLGRTGSITEIEKNITVVMNSLEIKDVIDGMGDINLKAKVLNISEMRMFNKKDGSVGRVCNLEIGDITGKIRVTLWDDKTDITEELEVDDSIEILNAYARENNFSQKVELQIGDYGIIKKIDETVEFKETFTEIIDIVPDSAYSIEGEVSGKGDIREFSRDDGTPGIVANINVSDNTGDIRVTLWGAHANIVHELEIGAKVEIIDAYAKSGFNDETELSLGERGKIKF